jgi:hypothetical protein
MAKPTKAPLFPKTAINTEITELQKLTCPISRNYCCDQGCGAGSGSVLDPYSIGSVDPDPDPYSEFGSGSGSRRAKMTHKSRKKW